MKKIVKLSLIFMLLTVLLILSACGDRQQATTAAVTEERHVRFAIADIPTNFNPHTQPGIYELLELFNLGMYTRWINPETGTWQTIPELAVGLPEMVTPGDFTRWRHTARRGMTFEDGTPIDARTVVESYKWLSDPLLLNRNVGYALIGLQEYFAGEGAWEDVGIELVDDYTIIVTYREEMAPVNAREAMTVFGWMGPSIVHVPTYVANLSADGTTTLYGTSMDTFVASGLYRISAYIPGQYWELEKWNTNHPLYDYYTADRVSWVWAPELATQHTLFETGQIDIVNANDRRFDDYPGLFPAFNSFTAGLFLNPFSTTNPILQDVDFRHAIYWAIDRQTIIDTIHRTSAVSPRIAPLASTVWHPDDESLAVSFFDWPGNTMTVAGRPITATGYDAAFARELFDRAYARNGSRPITMEVSFSDLTEAGRLFGEFMQFHLQNVFGVDRFRVTLRALPTGTIVQENLRRDVMDYEIMAASSIWRNVAEPWNDTNFIYTPPRTFPTQYCVLTPAAAREWDRMFLENAEGDNKFDQRARIENSIRMEQVKMTDMTFVPTHNLGSRFLIADHLEPIMDQGDPELGTYLFMAIWHR
ncbi:MAG: ABC transporter substrate-binding protein [Treponema sp.]|nr:ABC transporter substrate-binding protein [Treponema sp.]